MKTLNELLDQAAQNSHSSMGLITAEEKISYAELKTRVLSIATALKERGVRFGDRVAIIHRNSPAFIEAYFALSRLGAIAVPINYMIHNPEELAYMLNDCAALGVVTQKEEPPRASNPKPRGHPVVAPRPLPNARFRDNQKQFP